MIFSLLFSLIKVLRFHHRPNELYEESTFWLQFIDELYI